MPFKVSMNKKRKRLSWVGIILSSLTIAFLLFFLNNDYMAEFFQSDKTAYMIFIGFIPLFALLLALGIYSMLRPCICVNGESLIIYPLYRRVIHITLADITSREVKYDPANAWGNVAAGVAGGAVGAAIYQKFTESNTGYQLENHDMNYIYTYYSGNKKLVTIHTKIMENAKQFDKLVCDRLQEKCAAQKVE